MDHSTAWTLYLEDQIAKGNLSAERRVALEAFLLELFGAAEYPPAQAQLGDDGRFYLVWDQGAHYLDIEWYVDGTHDWFYRNRLVDEVQGSEAPAYLVSPQCRVAIAMIVSAKNSPPL